MRRIALIAGIVLLAGAGFLYFLQKPQEKVQAPNAQTTIEDPTQQKSDKEESSTAKNGMNTITLETSKGIIVFETYDGDAPKAAENFITLSKKGFYDGLTFHRVISGFMLQGGDPNGTGTGGPGYKFEDELDSTTQSYKNGYKRGVVAMANSGPDTNGSQFFIMHKDYPLPNNYTIFGAVVKGIEVVDMIASVQTDSSDKPLTPVVIKKATVTAAAPAK